VDVADADVVAILTRAPSAGGKSRLFAALGTAPDPELLSGLLLDTVDGTASEAVRLVVAVTPPSACAEVAALVPRARVIPQGEGTLGERMRIAMQTLFDAGARRVVLIGSDLPGISLTSIAAALAALEPGGTDARTVVLGPSNDGGYYLVAATQVPPIFDGIEWSTASVLRDSRAAAARAGWDVRLIAPLDDVDSVEDLRAAASRLPASRTAAWVHAHLP
jgi:rSAM/selenodomain-associated transferase 1